MLRSFRAWAPVADEKWFFDKSVWQKMFRAMSGCGFDSMVFANARISGEDPTSDFAAMRDWILRSTPDYGITPYLAVDPKRDFGPSGTAEQAHDAFRAFLETHAELKGVFVDVSDGADYVQRVIVDALDAARPDAPLYLEGLDGPEGIVGAITRRGSRPIRYSVKYTHECLVDASPDPAFSAWVEAAGAENISAEIVASNFEPWTSFSYDTVEGVLSNLEELGCDGLSLYPLARGEWPRCSDTLFKLQWQRDYVWYSVWGGTGVQQLARQGLPKWLVRNSRLVPGFEAGSRVLEILSLYFAGDKRGSWCARTCSVVDETGSHVFSIEDMLRLDDMPAFSGRDWWEEISGDAVVHLREYIDSGTPEDAYGPEELIEELSDLSQQAVAAGEKGMRNASGEKELPSLSRDAFCMGRLGEFYVERLRAALSHARGADAEAVEHLARALGLYRELVEVDSSHREGIDWTAIVRALEAEQADASKGVWSRGGEYPMPART